MRLAVLAGVVGLVAAAPLRHRLGIRAAGLAVFSPPVAMAGVVVAVAVPALRRVQATRSDRRRVAEELPLLGDLIGLGMTGGQSFLAALSVAADHLQSSLRAEVQDVVRRVVRDGAAFVLETTSGSASRLYQLSGRALATGAPLVAAVQEFTDEARSLERTRRLAAARRLPVALMFPLALLILPGFVLLTVAPAVVGALERVAL